jgi:hypothetical protein
LANFEIIAEAGLLKSPIWVRIIKVMAHDECDGSPETCPKSTIYIATSEYGEYPEQKVFQLKKMHGWEFVEWVSFPEGEGPEDYVFEVKVNYHQAQIIQK